MSRSWTRYGDLPGLTNIGLVDTGIIRMGWPTASTGYQSLKDMGVKIRINLRTTHSDEEQCRAVDIEYISWPINEAFPPSLGKLREVVDLISKPCAYGCAYGSDRTGLVTYLKRIWVDGWSKTAAMEEFLSYVNPQTHFEIWPGIRGRIEEAA